MHKHHICPWWLGPWLAGPWRRLWQKPERILAGHVKPGMTVLEVGPGMGFWTVPIAKLVGPSGHVVALDAQERMLRGLRRRAKRAGVASRVEARLCKPESLDIEDIAGRVDFALAFAVVHEVPDAKKLMAELHRTLRPGGRLLVAEPSGRVSAEEFTETVAAAAAAGLGEVGRPAIARSRAVLLETGLARP